MCSNMPKDFEKATEVLPFTKCGLSALEDFKKADADVHHLEGLKKIGLSDEEIKLYQENEAGIIEQRNKIESSILKNKLENIYRKIKNFSEPGSSKPTTEEPSTSVNEDDRRETKNQYSPLKFYPEGHPMNEIKEIEESLFGHLKNDDIIPTTKRRKILRRFERKKERIMLQAKQMHVGTCTTDDATTNNRIGSLWDCKEVPVRLRSQDTNSNNTIIGPKKQTLYTIKDKKILRLEPVNDEEEHTDDEFRAVDIVIPLNPAEEQLLEGTKMAIDDIRKIERFKDYEPGIPSKVLYLKNIAPSVPFDQLKLLFNQFIIDNGGPAEIRLMSGRMRGQAFVSFRKENVAIQALEEVNGTILGGRPVIAQFGRNSNRIQMEDIR